MLLEEEDCRGRDVGPDPGARDRTGVEPLIQDGTVAGPVDPGEITLEAVNPPQFRALLASIPLGKPTEPLVSREGILVMVVCTRDQKNIAVASTEEIQRSLIEERVELISRQSMRDLHRQANIDLRGNGV